MQTEISSTQTDGPWLTLTDYSAKYRVSISTLRRRIKTNQIEHLFRAGKYLLKDAAPSVETHEVEDTHSHVHEPAAHSMSEKLQAAAVESDDSLEAKPILATATKLLNELKKAYMSILQEKEEQMIQLKEEVADLKTLVRVLEQDNDRLRAQHIARMNQ